MEIWKQINDFEGFYEISNYGRVKSIKRVLIRSNGRRQLVKEKLLAIRPSKKGYARIAALFYQKRIEFKVHRLVAIHFISNPNNYKEVNHIDGNKQNNHFKNLEWCSRSQNVQHAFDNGLKFGYLGEDHPHAILTEKDVLKIRENKENLTMSVLAENYGVSKSAISFIIQRRSWKHI